MTDMTTSETSALLAANLIGRLAMVDAQGKPYTIPMRFVWHKGAVYVRLAHDGRKQGALERSRRVCFETDHVHPDFSHYASVLIEGTLVDVIDEDEKRAALVAMNEKYLRLAGLPSPGPNPVIHGVALRRISVDTLTGRKHEPLPAFVRREARRLA